MMPNRVVESDQLPAPTPPGMRVRTGDVVGQVFQPVSLRIRKHSIAPSS